MKLGGRSGSHPSDLRVWKEWQNEMDDQGNQEAIHPAGRVRGSDERCNDH